MVTDVVPSETLHVQSIKTDDVSKREREISLFFSSDLKHYKLNGVLKDNIPSVMCLCISM